MFVGSLSCTAKESAELQQHFQPPEYNYTFHNSYILAQSDVGKLLNKQKRCKPLIITVFNNQEVIYQLLSATHSWKVSEEQVETLDWANTERSDRVFQTAFLSNLFTDFFSNHFTSLPLSCCFSLAPIGLSSSCLQRSPPGCSQSADPISSRQPHFPIKGLTSHETTI